MRAVLVNAFGGPEELRVGEVAVPEPGPGQVRIAVDAAAVNPVDVVTRAGLLHGAGLHGGAPVRFGWDAYGLVEAVGAGVHRLRVGQAVIGLSDRLSAPSKTHADFVVLDQAAVAAVPKELDPAIGSTLPLAGLTAGQGLDRLGLVAGQSLLVTGAGGAVGSLAVQLARLRGLRVIAAARSGERDRMTDLGAEGSVVAGPRLAEDVRRIVPGGVDGALDAADLSSASLDAVRTGGAHLSLVVLQRPAPLRAIRSESMAIAADWEQLTVLASLAATNALHVSIAHEMELGEVAKAHELVAGGGLTGRVVLRTR